MFKPVGLMFKPMGLMIKPMDLIFKPIGLKFKPRGGSVNIGPFVLVGYTVEWHWGQIYKRPSGLTPYTNHTALQNI